ncbi:MAG: malate dehydrogenase (quinone) [Leadbetterella sp.]
MPHSLKENPLYADIILIGAGVMSATLGTMLKLIQPDIKILIVERLNRVAAESTDAWNNAGTGHSALCELNYTPQKEDGSVDGSKATKIFEAYQHSLGLWTYLVKNKIIKDPKQFIKAVPHISFVKGEKDVDFLRKRYDVMKKSIAFQDMEIIEDRKKIENLIPLVMEGRDDQEPVAITYVKDGTDVNFGTLTQMMFDFLKKQPGVKLRLNHEVQNLEKLDDGNWSITMDNLASKKVNKKKYFGNFVFVGAGGGALPILEKSDIKEADGYGGFPVSGQWLKCVNEDVIRMHASKVYGKAAVGAPPMSVPHLDSRYINGKKELLFGPFAGFTTKFLKEGSLLDLPSSITFKNIIPMLQVGLNNFDLTKYLIEQVIQSPEDRIEALKEYLPTAKLEDWELLVAGQRVQVIKKGKDKKGVLEFGTELVSSSDGSIAALLGASPGASTAVDVMLKLIKKCFPEHYNSADWQKRISEILPHMGTKFMTDSTVLERFQAEVRVTLGLA